MTSVEDGKAVTEIKRGLSQLGYNDIDTRILRAEDYGVPQERRRLVFLANRKGKNITWPAKLYDGKKKPFTTIGDAILDLPELANGEGEEIQEYPFPLNESTSYQRVMRVGSKKVVNHVSPSLSKVNLERMKFIPQGGSWRDLPIELLPAGMKQAKRSDHTKRYGRMRIEGLSCTILTKCDLHWGAFIHPTQDRSITVREAARIQSFPDRFIFLGPKTEQYRQVGNAVPPLLAKAIANHILNLDQQSTSTKQRKLELE
jgi:DNA (cytosine-5)-methyltransferase 1